MIASKIPSNECDRLKDLFEYEVLDTPPEGNFDDLASLASHICEAPISLISLVDENRQWFKARVGLEVQQTSRELSFCSHAIHGTEIFEIPNTLVDDRFKNNPLVTSEPHIRFYAGIPLVTPRGYAIGTLCVIDKIPRRLSENQKRGLRTLARQVVDLLELRLSNKNITALNENLTQANRRINQQQDALVQSAKLQTMGAMSSGICYELGNPLSGIDGRLKMLMDAVGSDRFEKNSFSENLIAIDKNIRRIERMVKTLRQFTLDDDLVTKKVDLHELMHDLVTLLRERFSTAGVKLLFDLPEGGDFNCSYNQISQVLINLLHNAFDAAFGRPNAWVKIAVEITEEEISFHVSDSGAGLTEEIRKHLFEPFFTTKPIGKGIGLSLYISQGIVENHRGQLFLVQGAPNTTFTMKIPR